MFFDARQSHNSWEKCVKFFPPTESWKRTFEVLSRVVLRLSPLFLGPQGAVHQGSMTHFAGMTFRRWFVSKWCSKCECTLRPPSDNERRNWRSGSIFCYCVFLPSQKVILMLAKACNEAVWLKKGTFLCNGWGVNFNTREVFLLFSLKHCWLWLRSKSLCFVSHCCDHEGKKEETSLELIWNRDTLRSCAFW